MAVTTRIASGSRWTALARAAGSFGLTGLTGENVHGAQWGSVASTAVALMDVQHAVPHVAGTATAEVDFALHGGLQGLHIVKDQGEGEQAGCHGDGRKNYGAKGDNLQRRLPAFGLLVHLFVLSHR